MSILNERGGARPKFNEDAFFFKWVGLPYLTDDVGIELLREVLEAGEAYWVDLGKRVARASRDRVISLSQQGIFEDLLNIRQVYLRQPTSLLDGFRDGGYGPDPLPCTHEYICMIMQMRAAGITSSDSRDSSGRYLRPSERLQLIMNRSLTSTHSSRRRPIKGL